MSPRAAWRLERLGFDPVHDYTAGKADWLAAGLPTVRADPSQRRALDAADRDAPTCAPGTRLRELPATGPVVVVSDDRILLGRVGPGREGDLDRLAEDAMQPGPTTVRADEPLDPLLERMRAHDVTEMLVTTPEGRLLGVVRQPGGEEPPHGQR